MDKTKVLAAINKFKDRPIEIKIDGDITVYGNYEGRWLLDGGDYLIAVAKNTPNGSFQLNGSTQNDKPFSITYSSYNDVFQIRSYIDSESGSIQSDIGSFTPLGTSKTIGEVVEELESDSIHKASSPRGFQNVDNTDYKSSYGHFRGSIISTSSEGIPENLKNSL